MVETGFFYGSFIDPVLSGMRKKVAAEISVGETVIDIACGTGAQVRVLAGKVKRGVGVDLSESMINYAKKQSKQQNIKNVAFVVGDATALTAFANNEFDVAILSLALHQFSPELYYPILTEIKRISNRLLIADYAVPLPANFAGVASKTIEFLAGREHNRCFKQYYKAGGLEKILQENGLKIEKTKLFGGGAFNLVTTRVRF